MTTRTATPSPIFPSRAPESVGYSGAAVGGAAVVGGTVGALGAAAGFVFMQYRRSGKYSLFSERPWSGTSAYDRVPTEQASLVAAARVSQLVNSGRT